MTDAKPPFIDTNTLVYANVQESPFHAQALVALQTAYESERPLWISRQQVSTRRKYRRHHAGLQYSLPAYSQHGGF